VTVVLSKGTMCGPNLIRQRHVPLPHRMANASGLEVWAGSTAVDGCDVPRSLTGTTVVLGVTTKRWSKHIHLGLKAMRIR
jgi:hypothetical protein